MAQFDRFDLELIPTARYSYFLVTHTRLQTSSAYKLLMCGDMRQGHRLLCRLVTRLNVQVTLNMVRSDRNRDTDNRGAILTNEEVVAIAASSRSGGLNGATDHLKCIALWRACRVKH
jgi:hypothetical protein